MVKGRGDEQDLIPYVGQLEFANVPTEGWIIDPDEHGLFDGPCVTNGNITYQWYYY